MNAAFTIYWFRFNIHQQISAVAMLHAGLHNLQSYMLLITSTLAVDAPLVFP